MATVGTSVLARREEGEDDRDHQNDAQTEGLLDLGNRRADGLRAIAAQLDVDAGEIDVASSGKSFSTRSFVSMMFASGCLRS